MFGLEGEDPSRELVERCGSRWREDLALDDAEVDLDLVSHDAWIERWMRRRFR